MRILVITNESNSSSAPGQRDALQILEGKGFIKDVKFISYNSIGGVGFNFVNVLNEIKSKNFDLLFLWSPKNFPETEDQFSQIVEALGERELIYWEGDPWTTRGIKRIYPQMEWWARLSTVIFSVAGNPQKEIFEKFTRKVILIPHTYCHFQFKTEEQQPPSFGSSQKSFLMIANQVAKIPYVYGVPGSGSRFTLASLLKLKYSQEFDLRGSGWPNWFKASPLAYAEQASVIRSHSFSLNWDNFPNHESYASDRLPIALLAGRVHLTSKHPGMNFYGTEDVGLFEYPSPAKLVNGIQEHLQRAPEELFSQGLTAHKWAKNRLSHREAAYFMVSMVNSKLPQMKSFPWNKLT
jgi:hypothetical protein